MTKASPFETILVMVIIISVLICILSFVLTYDPATPISISKINIAPQINDMRNKSWSEEDSEDWVIFSKTEMVSGLHLKKVYARRLSDNFVHSIFTEKEYAIGAHVKVAWVHHRLSGAMKQVLDLPIILMRCN